MHAKSQKLLHHQVSLHSCHSKDLRGEWTWSTHWNNDCINTFLSFNQRVNIVNWTEETGDTNGFTSTSVKSSFKPSVSWSNANKTYQIVQNHPKTYHNSARVQYTQSFTIFQPASICKIKPKECGTAVAFPSSIYKAWCLTKTNSYKFAFKTCSQVFFNSVLPAIWT